MTLIKTCRLLTALLSSIVILSGCTSPGKHMIPPGGEMTMPEIYQQETGIRLLGQSGDVPQNSLQHARQTLLRKLPPTDYVDYTASAKNEVHSLFKPLPNPEIPLYIYPHLVTVNGESYPKPGLTTNFFLYKQNHFAMPNEMY